ncbi:MAG: hypothetical protein H0V19_08800 [Euzebyales bacterium]|nr:hypothetical protein [Euzebyales bacterium]MBA3622234.1 hypothetical protein [Euzebyales bacterium]
MSTALLVTGYLLSAPTTVLLLRICRRRWRWAFAALEAGTGLVALGWALRGERLPAWMNAGFGFGFACTWVAVGRMRRSESRSG